MGAGIVRDRGQAVFVYVSSENHCKFVYRLIQSLFELFLVCISPLCCRPFVLAFLATILKVTSVLWFSLELIQPCILSDRENRGEDDGLAPSCTSRG
jgi:hypothetical protein